MIEIQIRINSTEEALELVRQADKLQNEVDFTNGRVLVDAKSILGVLTADFSRPCKLIILTDHKEADVEDFIASIRDNIIKTEELKS